MTDPDASICPLCGQDNQCMAKSDTACWCTTLTIPEALLARIPSDKRNKACICRQCIDAYMATQHAK